MLGKPSVLQAAQSKYQLMVSNARKVRMLNNNSCHTAASSTAVVVLKKPAKSGAN